MYSENLCSVCGSKSNKIASAVIAPFIGKYAKITNSTNINLVECSACGLIFFDKRFSKKELAKVYSGYRGKKYYEARHNEEPWYTKSINDSIGSNEKEILFRKNMIKKTFIDGGIKIPLPNLLDYGGDKGQFIPEGLAGKKYVYEISDVETVNGVTGIRKLDKKFHSFFKAVLVCNVFEHVNNVRSELESILKYLRKDSYIYIEVPNEKFRLAKRIMRSSFYKNYLLILCKNSFVFKCFDFLSVVFRIIFNIQLPFGLIKMHEHINIFTESSLEKLAQINKPRMQKVRRIEKAHYRYY